MKWIPIEEQPPVSGAPNLLTITTEAEERRVELGYTNVSGGIFTFQHEEVTSKAVAWMPLPQAYQA